MSAPPSRTGFSRSAQYLLFAGYVVTVLGALLGVLLLITSWADPAGHRLLRERLTDATAPLSAGGASVSRGAGVIGRRIGDWWRAGQQNEALRRELAGARVAMVDVSAVRAENARLKRLVRLVERDGRPVAATRLVASSPVSLRRFAVVPVGRTSGVAPNQTVRGPTGLAGRVVEASAISARVLLITDTASTVPVRRATDDLAAVAVGDGTGGLEIRPLSNFRVILRSGDLFVTNGIGGVFPPGIPVAVLRSAEGSGELIARPTFDPNLTDPVLILPLWEPAAAVPVIEPTAPASEAVP